MADVPVTVGLVLSDSDIKRVSGQITKDLGSVGDKVGPKIGAGLVSGLGTAVKSLIGPLGAAFASAFAFKKIISEASEFEAQVNRLNSALRIAGTFSKQASIDFQAFASEIQRTTTFGDGLTLELAALSLNFAKTNEQAKQLTRAALDLSVATGEDARTSIKQLGETYSGTAGRLSKLVPELKNLTAAQLRAGDAVDIVSKRFSGAARDEVNSYSGAIKQLNNNVGDLAKQFGLLVTQSKSTGSLIQALSNAFGRAAESVDLFRRRNENSVDIFNIKLKEANVELKRAEDLLKKVQDAGGSLNLGGAFNLSAETAAKSVDNLRLKIQLLEEDRKRAAVGPIAAQPEAPKRDLSGFNNALLASQVAGLKSQRDFNAKFLSGEQRAAADRAVIAQETALINEQQEIKIAEAKKAFLESGLVTQREFSVLEVSLREEAANRIAVLNANSINQVNSIGEAVRATFSTVRDEFKAFSDSAEENLAKAGTQSVQTLTKGVANGFANVGKALAKGENLFEAFGGAIVAAMGQALIDLGSSYVLQGLARIIASYGADATGYKLVAIGGLMSIAGGALGASGGGASGANTSTGNLSGADNIGSTNQQSSFDTEQLVARESRVTVNIQGDVLDSQSTSLRIVELIKEATDNQGANLRFA